MTLLGRDYGTGQPVKHAGEWSDASFVFFNPNTPFDAKELRAAKKVARANGTAVVRAMVGSMLLEGPSEVMGRVAASLAGWRYEPESHYPMPERPSARGK
jgi:hypothetical protein